MNQQPKAVSRYTEQLAEDPRGLLATTADVIGEKVDEARKGLQTALDNGKSMLNRAEDELIREARATMECLRDNPRVSIAAAVALGSCIVAFGFHRKGR